MSEDRLDQLDYYTLLGAEPSAPTDAIRAAFHRFALKYHPDNHTGGGPERLARATPGLEVVVYDRPEVVKSAPAREGVRFEGGDFFERVPEGADAYILKAILHDWDDERAARILARCASAMKRGGRVLVVEQVISDAPSAALGKLSDLEMLVMTQGGHERTEPELRALFGRAGLELARVVPTESRYCVLEGRGA